MLGDALLGLRLIERDDRLLERDMRHGERHPRPQRPRRVIFVADDEMKFRHDAPHLLFFSGSFSTAPPASFQAANPPVRFLTGFRPMSCRAMVARSERQPEAQ